MVRCAARHRYALTNDSFSTSIELRLAISSPGMLSDAAVRRWGCGKMSDVNTVGALPRVMWSSSTVRAYKYTTNDSFSTSIELGLALSYPGMLSEAPCRRCGCGKMFDVNTVGALPRVMWSSSTSSFTSSTTSTSPCFSSSSPSSHFLQLLLVGSIRALACACGFGLWDTPRGAGFQARGGLAVFTRRGRGALLQTCRAPVSELFVCAQDCSPLPPPPSPESPPPLSPPLSHLFW